MITMNMGSLMIISEVYHLSHSHFLSLTRNKRSDWTNGFVIFCGRKEKRLKYSGVKGYTGRLMGDK